MTKKTSTQQTIPNPFDPDNPANFYFWLGQDAEIQETEQQMVLPLDWEYEPE